MSKQFHAPKGAHVTYGDHSGNTRSLTANGNGLITAYDEEDEQHFASLGFKPAREPSAKAPSRKPSAKKATAPAAPATPQPEIPADKEV